jgi:hypothetical protein
MSPSFADQRTAPNLNMAEHGKRCCDPTLRNGLTRLGSSPCIKAGHVCMFGLLVLLPGLCTRLAANQSGRQGRFGELAASFKRRCVKMGQDGAAAAAGAHNASRNAATKPSVSRLVFPTLLGSRATLGLRRVAGYLMTPPMPMSRARRTNRRE